MIRTRRQSTMNVDQTTVVVVNELLAYAIHYFKCSTKDSIRRVLQERFTREDVLKAKDDLVLAWITREGPEKRQDSTNRTALTAETEDLLAMITRYDEAAGAETMETVFAAVNMAAIPPVAPEEAVNTIAIAIRMAALEGKLNSLCKTVGENVSEINDIKAAEKYEKRKKPTMAAVVASSGVSPSTGNTSGITSEIAKQQEREMRGPPSGIQTKYTDNEGFTLPKQQRRQAERKKKISNMIVGKKKDDRLQSGPTNIDIIVKKVNKQFKCKDITSYLCDEGVQVKEDDVKIISHEDLPTYSFKVKINKTDKIKVLHEDFWPEGIESRIYYNNVKHSHI